MGSVGAGFAQGFGQTLQHGLALQAQLQRRDEELKIQKQLADASYALHTAQTQEIERRAQALSRLGQRLTGTGGPSVAEGEGLQGPGAPGAPIDFANPQQLQQMIPDLEQIQPGFLSTLVLSRLQMAEKQRMGTEFLDRVLRPGGPSPTPSMPIPSGAPSAPPLASSPVGPAAPPTAPPSGVASGAFAPETMQTPPKLTVDSEGKVSVTQGGELIKHDVKSELIPDPDNPGRTLRVTTAINPMNGQQHVLSLLPGVDNDAYVRSAMQAAGFVKPGTPAHTVVTNMMASLLGLSAQRQDQGLKNVWDWVQQNVPANQQGPLMSSAHAPAVPSTQSAPVASANPFAAAIAGSTAQAVAQTEAETRARQRAQREEGPLSATAITAISSHNNILTNLGQLRAFSPTEIQAYSGLLNRPWQDIKMFAQNTFGEGADARFAQFKTVMGRLKGTAFGEGGKQLTPFEASVVFDYTPTGREIGGATEIIAKTNYLEAFTKIAREVRIELERTGAADVAPDKMDALIKRRVREAGLPTPDVYALQHRIALPSQAPAAVETAPKTPPATFDYDPKSKRLVPVPSGP